jgi:hypothetical protein
MRYWLAGSGDPEAQRAAASVLSDIPAWPSRRGRPGRLREAAEQAAGGNPAAIAATVGSDCP